MNTAELNSVWVEAIEDPKGQESNSRKTSALVTTVAALALSACSGGVKVKDAQSAVAEDAQSAVIDNIQATSVDENYMQEVSEWLKNPFKVVVDEQNTNDNLDMVYGWNTNFSSSPEYHEWISDWVQTIFSSIPNAVRLLVACTKDLDWVTWISPNGEVKYYANECIAEKAGATQISPSGPWKTLQD